MRADILLPAVEQVAAHGGDILSIGTDWFLWKIGDVKGSWGTSTLSKGTWRSVIGSGPTLADAIGTPGVPTETS